MCVCVRACARARVCVCVCEHYDTCVFVLGEGQFDDKFVHVNIVCFL